MKVKYEAIGSKDTVNKIEEQDTSSANRQNEKHVDRIMCLTLHQPWASLLVNGIKRAEVFRLCRSFGVILL